MKEQEQPRQDEQETSEAKQSYQASLQALETDLEAIQEAEQYLYY